MGRPRTRRPPTKRECESKLHHACNSLFSLAPIVQAGRFRPRDLYEGLDRVIGQLAEVQMTVVQRSRIRPRAKRGDRELKPDLWWPRYWKRVRELEAQGIDPNSKEASPHFEDLAADIFN